MLFHFVAVTRISSKCLDTSGMETKLSMFWSMLLEEKFTGNSYDSLGIVSQNKGTLKAEYYSFILGYLGF